MDRHHTIRYILRKDLDIQKWDRCISASTNGLPYAYAAHLDYMSKNWDALVLNDYEAVMPLTYNKKYGIHYLYQPAFTAQLGVFGNNLSATLIKAFVAAVPKKFRLIEIELNQHNDAAELTGATLRNNYVLDLNKPYDTITGLYRDNIKRNIKKAQQANNRYATNIAVEEVIALSRSQMQSISNLTETDYDNFAKLFHQLQPQGKALACGVYTTANQLIASCVYFITNNRACYIMVGNHPNGRTAGASHYLIDRFIHDHSNQHLLLDFEGSDIRNLAFFYGSFGATLETYPSLRINRLPALIRWLK
ncbi:hypothetical protein HHL16_19060 [Pseudoflavitalea sp. G-6-1-2]|uniref:GNAT family N-acetyltransferase n=1 Tax=Pseudoflavitalea sp. G-6-1-2 TaxID=2728841 RepID=UPI00146DEDE4|nr:GNAT family N-acetyltransferase [Pseudoflavitalea sp. G-6-1-2]NML22985.1 hypothetical protein [Pseudoflavitalea sp. G-6-1-2]